MEKFIVATAMIAALSAGPAIAGPEDYLGEIFAVPYADLSDTGFDKLWCPKDSAIANGALVNIRDNSPLYSLIGTRFGGDGRATFALPDLTKVTLVSPVKSEDGKTDVAGKAEKLTWCIVVHGVYPQRP
jgi:microcystin-dependent protein